MQNTSTFARIHHYVLVFLISSLSVTVVLKIGEIQYLEFVFVADFILLMSVFALGGWKAKVFRPFFGLAMHYILFLGAAFLLAVIALRQDFFPFSDAVFKRPLLLTVSRMVELFLDVFYMLYLASLYREDQQLCVFGAKTYYWVGIVGCIYGVLTFPLNFLYDLQLGTYSDSHRIRGFNNEAGSFGTYLISVCMLALAMYRLNWISKRQLYLSMTLFLVCLVGSQSKAAFFVVAMLVMIGLIWTLKGWRLWVLFTGTCTVFVLLAIVIDLKDKIDIYAQGSAAYQEYSLLKANDGNYVMGRVSGAVLAPRMITAHPWLGIGWGNYPLVRDDPQYRQGTAFSIAAVDSPSLGPIDYIVELGFPLWIYMTWISLRPVSLLRRQGADVWLLSMAIMQPLSNWFGAHLNITYPWVVVGLALGMGFSKIHREKPVIMLSVERLGL